MGLCECWFSFFLSVVVSFWFILLTNSTCKLKMTQVTLNGNDETLPALHTQRRHVMVHGLDDDDGDVWGVACTLFGPFFVGGLGEVG